MLPPNKLIGIFCCISSPQVYISLNSISWIFWWYAIRVSHIIKNIRDKRVPTFVSLMSCFVTCVNVFPGFECVADDSGEGATRAVKQMLHHLKHISAIWHDVLPTNVYCRGIGLCLLSPFSMYSTILVNLNSHCPVSIGDELCNKWLTWFQIYLALFLKWDGFTLAFVPPSIPSLWSIAQPLQ